MSTTSEKIYIGMPIAGGVPAETLASVVNMVVDADYSFRYETKVGGPTIFAARNAITENFLQSNCDRLMFIDSDLVFQSAQVKRIICHDEDIVGGFYPIKDPAKLRWCVNGPPGAMESDPDERGLTKVHYIGTGFMCIRRHVFEKLMAAGKAPEYLSDGPPEKRRIEHDFWRVGVYEYPDKSRRYLSEDWYFCQNWMDLGGTVWGDCKIALEHVGQAKWPLPHMKSQIVTSKA